MRNWPVFVADKRWRITKSEFGDSKSYLMRLRLGGKGGLIRLSRQNETFGPSTVAQAIVRPGLKNLD